MASNMVHKSPYAVKGTDLDGNTERIVYKQTCRRDESMRVIPMSGGFIFASLFCNLLGQISILFKKIVCSCCIALLYEFVTKHLPKSCLNTDATFKDASGVDTF